MGWSNSKVFRPFIADVLGNVVALDLDADAFKIALFNDSITPDNDVTSANSCYNVGQWATANEVYQSGQWAQAGVSLGSRVLNSATADTVFFDGADTASGSAATLASVYGSLCYDDTMTSPADQGVCYNYFGGVQSVTSGTFTVVWHANGLFRLTL